MLETNSQAARVFFVDDEPGIRMAVQRTLESWGMHVTVFASAQDCIAELFGRACDVLITDVKLGGMDGFSLLREVKSRFPELPVVLVSGYGDIASAVAAMRAGAVDFIEKPLDRHQLLSVIEKAMEHPVQPNPSLQQRLSCAEMQVLRGIFDGKTNKEMAGAFKRSIRTIETHRRNIMRKFRVKNVVQLVQRAGALGFAHGATVDRAGDRHTTRCL